LDELINQQLLVAGAEQSGLTNKKDIDAAVEEFRRTLIVREVAAEITEDIRGSEADAREFYDENKEEMVGPTEWRVREIVLDTKAKATELLTQILSGADFAEMARLNSIVATGSKGGDLGYITEEPFAEMGAALLPLEEGDVSSVFKGPEGFYIVKLEEKRDGAPLAFDDAGVNAAGRAVALLSHGHAHEALVMAQVEIGFGAVVGHVDFAVLEGVHGAGVDVDIGVELEHLDAMPAVDHQHSQRSGGQSFAQ